MSNRYFDPEGLARVGHMELVARQVVEGFLTGRHRSPYHGFSVEYLDHRQYTPGDEIRDIDWKLLARTDKYYVKLFEDETNLRAYILLDCSRSMAFKSGPVSKLEYGSYLAAALSYLMLHQNDAVGLVLFDSEVRQYLPPRARPTQFRRILELLDHDSAREDTDVGAVLHEVAERIHRRGLVIVISDLIDNEEKIANGLQHFRHDHHEVLVFHTMDDAELTFPYDRLTRFKDMEGAGRVVANPKSLRSRYLARINTFLDTLKALCFERGISYNLANTKEPYDMFLAAYLEKRARLGEQGPPMSFLHWQLLLWTLPLALVPLLLHLLTLHRLKTVELATYRFLFDSYVQQRRRMQFLEALLAMLRAAFILFLVVALCRPMLQHWHGLFHSGSGREVILLVDCSASMNARTGGVPAFDRARSAARTVVEHLGPEDRLTLIRVASRPEEVFSRFTVDAATVQDKIDNLKVSPSRGNLFAALMQLFGPEAPKHTNPVVYLFTDCQASGWREVRNQGLANIIPKDTPFIVVNVGSNEELPNLAVIGDAPHRDRAIVGLPVVLQPRVVNHSKEPAKVDLTVLVDEKEVTRTTLTLKPNETATRKIVYVPTDPGVHLGRFEIANRTPDRFPDDDAFRFTLSVVPRMKVVLVNGNPSVDPLESETLYLRAALTATATSVPADKKAAALDTSKEIVRSLDVQEVPESALNAEVLRDAAVVVLANCGTLNVQHFTWLRDFVSTGGGLLVFPGDRVNPQVYDTQFFPVPGPQNERLTGVTLGPPEGDPEKADTFERLAVIDFAHPVMTVFDDPDAHYLRGLRFYRRYKLTMPEKKQNTWPLAEFTNGTPALVESRLGDGLVVLAAFPANTKWSNLPVKPEFVPLVLRLVSHVKHRPEVEGPAVVPAEGVAEIAVTGAWAPVEATVTDASHRPGPPLTFERSGSRLLATYDHTAEPGYYAVEVQSHGPQPKTANLSFAVNLSPEESDFTTVGENQLQELLPSAKLTVVDASAQAQQLNGSLGEEYEVWRPLIYLVFVIIAVEFLLATLRGGRRAREENLTVSERLERINPGTWVGRMTGAGRNPT